MINFFSALQFAWSACLLRLIRQDIMAGPLQCGRRRRVSGASGRSLVGSDPGIAAPIWPQSGTQFMFPTCLPGANSHEKPPQRMIPSAVQIENEKTYSAISSNLTSSNQTLPEPLRIRIRK